MIEPKKRIKFCEWEKLTGKKCGAILTEKQHDYCKGKELPFLCWGHQKQNELLKHNN